jgi:hypothetical protein
VTRYWDKEIEFLHTYRARVTNGTSRGLNLHGIKIARAVCRRADFTSARLVLRRTNEAADVRHLNVVRPIPHPYAVEAKERRQTEEPRCHTEETTGWR